MVKKVVEEIAKYKNITELTEKIDENKIITLNNYVSTEISSSSEQIKKLGLNPIILGSGKYIIKQYPTKGTTILSGNKVFLVTNDEKYKMPNVIGWSSTEISTLCKLLNINLKENGYGSVKAQSIAANADVKAGMTLEVTLG